jgi:hypothetical protein
LATASAHGLAWPVDTRRYYGCIDDPDGKGARLLLRHRCGDDSVENELHERYGFISAAKCTGRQGDDGRPCEGCLGEERFLRRKCQGGSNWNEEASSSHVQKERLDLQQSPTKLRAKLKEQTKLNTAQTRKLKIEIQRLKARMKADGEGDLSEGFKRQLGIDHQAELYQPPKGMSTGDYERKIQEIWEEALSGETIERKELARALWKENKLHAERALESGKSSCLYSKPMLHYAIQLRMKLGVGRYRFCSAASGLPGDTKVQKEMAKNSTASTEANGGILVANIVAMGEQLKDAYGEPELGWDDPRRSVTFGFDSAMIVEGIETSKTTNEVIGAAFDEDGGISPLRASLRSLADVFEDDDDNGSRDNEKEKSSAKYERSKHFIVFIATTLDKNKAPISTTVARFGLKTVTSDFLKAWIDPIIDTLCTYGLMVVFVAMDGAPENRAWTKWRATHSIEDLVELGLLPKEWLEDKLINSKMKIAFRHEGYSDEHHVFVIIHPDMPHLIKKLVNALDASSDDESHRNLWFDDHPLSLGMLHQIWSMWKDQGPEGKMRVVRWSLDHFDRHSNNKMRTFLALQITSASGVELVDEMTKNTDLEADYKSVRNFMSMWNTTIDVMNARKPDFSGIDSKKHKDIDHLLHCARETERWKQQNKQDDDLDLSNFLPMTTYEDAQWMCLGTCVAAHLYCETGVPFKIDLGRCGTDCCEYRFGNLKGNYSHRLTHASANQGSHIADVHNSKGFNMKDGTNTSGRAIPTAPLQQDWTQFGRTKSAPP